MKNINILLVSLCIIITSACSDEETDYEMIIDNCSMLSDKNVLSEVEKSNTCNFTEVYSYQNDIYLRFICCLCNQIDTAVSCDGVPFCGEWVDNDTNNKCMEEFYEEATYLFSVDEL